MTCHNTVLHVSDIRSRKQEVYRVELFLLLCKMQIQQADVQQESEAHHYVTFSG
jgi:hypothetical protein